MLLEGGRKGRREGRKEEEREGGEEGSDDCYTYSNSDNKFIVLSTTIFK